MGARGCMYEICWDPDNIGRLSEYCLEDGMAVLADDYVEDLDEEIAGEERELLLKMLKKCGAEVGITDNGIPWFVPGEETKKNLFRKRFEEVKKEVEEMTLEDFCDESFTYELERMIRDGLGDWVYDDKGYWHYMDTFFRDLMEPGEKYYLGNIVALC